jgi:BMFP domain-containing protein YqiC
MSENTLSRLESLRRYELNDKKMVHVEIITQAIERITMLEYKVSELEQQLAESADTEQVLYNTRNMAAEKFSEFRKENTSLKQRVSELEKAKAYADKCRQSRINDIRRSRIE